jgi:hypothetical protein
MHRFAPGYQGHDAMREKAEKMFRIASGEKSASSSRGRETIHRMPKEQSDLVLPNLVKKTSQQTIRIPFKKGGHAMRKQIGEDIKRHQHKVLHKKETKELDKVKKLMKREPKNMGGACYKKGGHAMGGSVYERQMVGEHPSRKPPHINYESELNGEKVIRKRMAMGGVGKMRKDVKSPKKGRNQAEC